MRKRWACALGLVLGLSVAVNSSEQDMAITGPLTTADHEADEGYFAIGQEFAMFAKPGTLIHGWLKDAKDQTVTVVFLKR
jgi:hypothetical protein